MAATTLTSASLQQSTGLATFSGLRATTKSSVAVAVKSSTKRCSRCIAAAADNCSHAAADTTVSATFASVSTATAAAPAPSSPLLFPAALGAGLLGAAAAALLKGSGSSSTAAPATAPVLKTSFESAVVYPRASTAAPAALATMAADFPTAMTETTFITTLSQQLAPLGFTKDNCIALVNTCRDEVCRPLVNLIDKEFGLSFNIAGLGGLINAGTVGFGAGMAHSPEAPCGVDGTTKERYIFFAFPHVSVGETGEVGSLLRRGRGKASNACGALIAIKGDIAKGAGPVEDEWNEEYNLLKKKVIAKVPSKSDPTLADVTNAALQAITEDLETLVSKSVDPSKADYAVITGVQIHSGNQIPGEAFRLERTVDYVAPFKMYAVVRGQRIELEYPASKTVAAIAK